MALLRLAHYWASLLIVPTCCRRSKMQIQQTVSLTQQGVSTVSNALAQMNPWLTHQQSVARLHLFNLNRFLKIDATKHPFKISSVSSGNVSHARAEALFFHFDHIFVVFKNERRRSHAGTVSVRSHKNRNHPIYRGVQLVSCVLWCSRHCSGFFPR